MKYLGRFDVIQALKWMTAVEQLLGVTEDGQVRWIRIDPLADNGIEVRVFEEPLACDPAEVDKDTPRIASGPVPPPPTTADTEDAAISRAHELGADPDRWVNRVNSGWPYLCLLRGHE